MAASRLAETIPHAKRTTAITLRWPVDLRALAPRALLGELPSKSSRGTARDQRVTVHTSNAVSAARITAASATTT